MTWIRVVDRGDNKLPDLGSLWNVNLSGLADVLAVECEKRKESRMTLKSMAGAIR